MVDDRSANAALIAQALDTGPVAVLIADRNARFVAANTAACELLGRTLPGVADVVVDGPAGEEMFADLVRDGEQRGLTPLKHRDGSTLVVRYFAHEVAGAALYAALIVARRTIPADASAQADAARRPRSRDRAALSTREFEILALLAEGLENDEIARSLHLAPDTVKAHVSRVLSKLGARSRTHAVVLALRAGLVD
jgi:DNA-binding CsgD family transcriptional regulator